MDFSTIEKKLVELLENYNDIKKKVVFLEEENFRLKNKLREAQSKNIDLTKNINNVKVASAISGNQEYKKMMKLKMNQLIKEVDLCISQIKKNS